MAKSLVLGNGSLTVGLDQFGQVKDCYFDYVGLENQMGEESVNRIGVWVDGMFSWISDKSWNISIDYQHETLVSDIVATNLELGIELHLSDAVYNENNIFIRHIIAKNLQSQPRTIRIFFNHEFRMYGTRKGDTVYWDPVDHTIVHYKGRRVAVIGGLMNDKPFSDYTVGLSTIEGKEGTWRDAEDGVLSKNAVEHGTVDSTVALEHTLDSEGSASAVLWVSFAKTHEEAKSLYQYAFNRGPGRLIETTEDYWRAWVNKIPYNFYNLSPEVVALFKKSLLILRTHVGNTGEVIASVDSDMLQWGRDNYNYVWPRDGSYVAMALDRANYSEVSRRFFEFCNEVVSPEGYFFHKYRPDKSLGSSWHPWAGLSGEPQLPIQEDETAMVLVSLWYHYQKTFDLEFIEKVYNSLIKLAANFLLGFRNKTKLPSPSYDLWEMKWGTHTYTVANVYNALNCAANFAELLGKEYDSSEYAEAAKQLLDEGGALWNEKTNYFYKSIDKSHKNSLHDESIDSSSFFGAIFNGFLKDSDREKQAYETLLTRLTSRGETGGIVRFEQDAYFSDDPESRGNPWIVTTLWNAEYLIDKATSEKDFEEVLKIFNWVHTHSQKSGILPEQLHPHTGVHLSAEPLAWSHAEFVSSVMKYLEKVQELHLSETIPETPTL